MQPQCWSEVGSNLMWGRTKNSMFLENEILRETLNYVFWLHIVCIFLFASDTLTVINNNVKESLLRRNRSIGISTKRLIRTQEPKILLTFCSKIEKKKQNSRFCLLWSDDSIDPAAFVWILNYSFWAFFVIITMKLKLIVSKWFQSDIAISRPHYQSFVIGIVRGNERNKRNDELR